MRQSRTLPRLCGPGLCGQGLLGALLFTLCLGSAAWGWEGTVVAVSDGDSLALRTVHSGKRVSVRLYGIDCPELGGRTRLAQPYGRKAAAFTRGLALGMRVSVTERGKDSYGRTLAGVVTLPDGRVLQEELLRAGLAWVYTRYCTDCTRWKELERDARAQKRGLWRDDRPVPPWRWRQGRAPERR